MTETSIVVDGKGRVTVNGPAVLSGPIVSVAAAPPPLAPAPRQFLALQAEYQSLLATMQVTKVEMVEAVTDKLLNLVALKRYDEVSAATGIPAIVIATSFEREASSNFNLSPAQGDPWNRVSVHVPRGRGPFRSWAAAGIDAYAIDGLDRVRAQQGGWTWPRALYSEESFNGFGYRVHGVHSPYLWAGTTHYRGGMFVRDGVYSASAVDPRVGVVPIMVRMARLNPSLAFAALPAPISGSWPSTAATSPKNAPTVPLAAPEGFHDAAELQKRLNALGCDPHLVVDGSYGRQTRRAVEWFQHRAGIEADGIAGRVTWAALDRAAPKT